MFAEVVCRKKMYSGFIQTHCWEHYKMLFSTPHLAEGFNPLTEFNLVRIASCTFVNMEKLEDGNFLDRRHFSHEMPFSCICWDKEIW